MAEALAEGALHAASAGSHPKPLHADPVRVMRRREIDLAGRRSKHVSEVADRGFDYVAATACARSAPSSPARARSTGASATRHASRGTDDETMPRLRAHGRRARDAHQPPLVAMEQKVTEHA
jgi:protein-tyrosine-phosphatase